MRAIAVPVKSLARAKTRLAPVLSPLERAALSLALLEDVLDAALDVPGWEVWVVSPDEAVLEVAVRRGATPVMEHKPPLAAAIRQAEEEATERANTALAVLPADLPLLTAEELSGALQTLGPVVASPASTDGGTNLLLRRPPRAIPARFGPDSFRKHEQSAGSRGLPFSVVESPGLAFDLDLPEHIPTVLAEARRSRTAGALLELDVEERLDALAGR
ncbi:MAG TPA: 2-phospho-L-lactate guanylyltransferase [Actinomycetota bacterium]|nr:2-phospho-L-lactate guanylyltransferase [Actinomycetota bacterium]